MQFITCITRLKTNTMRRVTPALVETKAMFVLNSLRRRKFVSQVFKGASVVLVAAQLA